MMQRAVLYLAITACLYATVAAGQVPVKEVNLADRTDLDVEVAPNVPFRIRIINRAPGADYRLTVQFGTINIRPLEPPPKGEIEVKGPGDPCAALDLGTTALRGLTNEAQVPAAVQLVESELRANNCRENGSQIAARQAIDATRLDLPDVVSLPAARSIEVTVERIDGAAVVMTRKARFHTGAIGEWGALSTLAFIPTRDDEYFTEQQTDSSYKISRAHDRRTADVVPAVLFTWASRGRENNRALWSVAGGLGFDSSNPVVMLGGAVTFFRNLGITAGVAAHRQRRLASHYDENDTVKENLTADQLHQTTYAPNLYFGIFYRFGSPRNLTEK